MVVNGIGDGHMNSGDDSGRNPILPRPEASSDVLEVSIPAAGVDLMGDLCLVHTEDARGVIVFAHGSGSSRKSPRNQLVARVLNQHGFSTLLVDLLTPAEHFVVSKRFDISLLTTRLAEIVYWVKSDPRLSALCVGLFGASTGAAAALRVAGILVEHVNCVVCRGGRTDLTGPLISRVRAPTLLIVGGEDKDVLAINNTTIEQLSCRKRLAVVPGATHLFEEKGALEDVAHIASYWFRNYVAHTELPDESPSPMPR